VKFKPGPQLSELESGTFCRFESLRSIGIAASVEILRVDCFMGADGSEAFRLETVTFEAGSKLREIETGAFFRCDR
jgi:hypothetical protein